MYSDSLILIFLSSLLIPHLSTITTFLPDSWLMALFCDHLVYQGPLYDTWIGTIFWSLIESSVGTQLNAMILCLLIVHQWRVGSLSPSVLHWLLMGWYLCRLREDIHRCCICLWEWLCLLYLHLQGPPLTFLGTWTYTYYTQIHINNNNF